MSQKFEKLKKILKELFQLDHPDLDFGLYRIMHAKAAEVTAFLERDLLPQVKAEFAQFKTADKAELPKELDKVVAGLIAAEVDPETSPKVKELRAKLKNDSVDIASLESDVFDHLHSFFSRYYSYGDFVSKRRYSKDGKYAIPYDGEEVKLYWANYDQYYIKTSEYLRDYAFRLKPDNEEMPMRVHFKLADVAEGEHGNVKAAAGKDRVFVLASTKPVFQEADELICRFEYRPATLSDWPDDLRSDKTKPPTQKDLTSVAEDRILAADGKDLAPWVAELAKPHVKADGEKADYNRLRVHLDRYVGRNTFDYFIHKDLGGFLKRELDFFLKNEVMMLDDIENESAPRVEQYLSKIKVIRRIAGKIITFLAQLEDFQKSLWLKKKFVVATQYCVALKEIPEEFLPEIVANAAQWAEWETLHHLSDLKKDDDALFAKQVKLKSPEFLKANPSLMIETRHFDADFNTRLLDALSDLDNRTDGVLFHSENFQALTLMQARYREKVKCVYIDPPYNTGSDGFTYKDNYQRSSWLSFIFDRIGISKSLLPAHGLFFTSIDFLEESRLRELADSVFNPDNFLAKIIWEKRFTRSNNARLFSTLTENILAYRKSSALTQLREPRNEKADSTYSNPDNDPRGVWTSVSYVNPASKADRPNLDYPLRNPITGKEVTHPTNAWKFEQSTYEHHVATNRLYWGADGGHTYPRLKKFLSEMDGMVPVELWKHEETGTTDFASKQLEDEFGAKVFEFPKPSSLVSRIVSLATFGELQGLILDFFAGTAPTGHAVIKLNREDGGRRKLILVEMADYFETVLLPRLKKLAFTPEWKDGQPKRLATAEEVERGPRVFKIIRLESYEDTLNNLKLNRSISQQSLLDAADAQGADKLREQYLLQYLLKVETRESPSLLNVNAFTDPTAYKLLVKRPGSDESREVNVDLLETFNWLLGLTVEHIATPQVFSARFERDAEKRLQLNGRLKPDAVGPYWFRTVTGTMPDGRKALVIWRKLTGKPEEDNLVLDEWFTKQGYSSKDTEFGLIYVNGGNNLENLKTPDDTWKVRLIEDDFQRLMFSGEGV
jgi:adenine-specific DNA-methyltransferase